MRKYFVVREKDVEVIVPSAHDDTINRNLLSSSDGSRFVEFVIGEMGSAGHADAHAHANREQINYIIEGKVRVTGDGDEVILEPGDAIFLPPGACHEFFCESEHTKYVVVFGPPREA